MKKNINIIVLGIGFAQYSESIIRAIESKDKPPIIPMGTSDCQPLNETPSHFKELSEKLIIGKSVNVLYENQPSKYISKPKNNFKRK